MVPKLQVSAICIRILTWGGIRIICVIYHYHTSSENEPITALHFRCNICWDFTSRTMLQSESNLNSLLRISNCWNALPALLQIYTITLYGAPHSATCQNSSVGKVEAWTSGGIFGIQVRILLSLTFFLCSHKKTYVHNYK